MDNSLAGALVGHCIGDYLIQNDWMALNKKKRTWPCLVHVTLYTLAVMHYSGWEYHDQAPAIAAAVFIPHFLIDRSQFVKWYMGVIGQSSFAQPPMAPWSFVAVDNTMHFLCLWVVAKFLEG